MEHRGRPTRRVAGHGSEIPQCRDRTPRRRQDHHHRRLGRREAARHRYVRSPLPVACLRHAVPRGTQCRGCLLLRDGRPPRLRKDLFGAVYADDGCIERCHSRFGRMDRGRDVPPAVGLGHGFHAEGLGRCRCQVVPSVYLHDRMGQQAARLAQYPAVVLRCRRVGACQACDRPDVRCRPACRPVFRARAGCALVFLASLPLRYPLSRLPARTGAFCRDGA